MSNANRNGVAVGRPDLNSTNRHFRQFSISQFEEVFLQIFPIIATVLKKKQGTFLIFGGANRLFQVSIFFRKASSQ